MKIFMCKDKCNKIEDGCIIIINDGGPPESCSYAIWSDNEFPEWIQINKDITWE